MADIDDDDNDYNKSNYLKPTLTLAQAWKYIYNMYLFCKGIWKLQEQSTIVFTTAISNLPRNTAILRGAKENKLLPLILEISVVLFQRNKQRMF